MTTKTLEFVFDFASPNAYLAYKALPSIMERTGASLKITPCLLGGIFKSTGNQAPMLAFADIPAKLNYMQVEMQRFIKKHQLTNFSMNPHFPVNTILLQRGALVAEENGRLRDYVDAGLIHMWEQGLKMDDPEVFVEAMNAAGLDGSSILEGTQNPDIKAKLIANTESAVARGAFGIPSFFIDDELFFGKDSLPDVEDALAQG